LMLVVLTVVLDWLILRCPLNNLGSDLNEEIKELTRRGEGEILGEGAGVGEMLGEDEIVEESLLEELRLPSIETSADSEEKKEEDSESPLTKIGEFIRSTTPTAKHW